MAREAGRVDPAHLAGDLLHPEPLRVRDATGERCGALPGPGSLSEVEVGAEEDVVPQHQRAGFTGNEILAEDEGPRQPLRARLPGIAEADAEAGPVPQQLLEQRQVMGGETIRISRIPASISTEIGERISGLSQTVSIRLVTTRARGQPQSRAGSPSQNDTLHLCAHFLSDGRL